MSEPGEIIPAIKRGIAKTREGTPALLEFLTAKETSVSLFGRETLARPEPVEG